MIPDGAPPNPNEPVLSVVWSLICWLLAAFATGVSALFMFVLKQTWDTHGVLEAFKADSKSLANLHDDTRRLLIRLEEVEKSRKHDIEIVNQLEIELKR